MGVAPLIMLPTVAFCPTSLLSGLHGDWRFLPIMSVDSRDRYGVDARSTVVSQGILSLAEFIAVLVCVLPCGGIA
jgi:hypothetical protein